MAAVSQLGYLGLGVKDVGGWRGYAESVLGLRTVGSQPDGDLQLGMDAHHHRFTLHEDDRDDIAYVGWQTESADEMNAIAERLEAAGVKVRPGSRETAERRHVAGLIAFDDPDGHAVEVFHGPEMTRAEAESPGGGEGFVAGSQGLGHLVLAAADRDRAMNFYTSMLGMKVSDYVEGTIGSLGFLHCNPRHHSIAFVQLANPRKRINHFMLQRESINDVGRTYDSVQEGVAPLLVTMGRHSNDEMVSFYMANPSGFGVEYGWGAREVDDCTWQVEQYDSGSLWGHKPVRRGDPVPRT